MSKVHIEVSPNGRDGKVIIDGHDIAPSTRGFRLSADVRSIPTLQLDLAIIDSTRIESQHVEVYLDPATAAYLERAGWTPPPGVKSVLGRDADGCPCERHIWWEKPDGEMAAETVPGAERKTILGRTVPTCPVHCSRGTALHRARVEVYGQGRDDEAAGLPLRYEVQ